MNWIVLYHELTAGVIALCMKELATFLIASVTFARSQYIGLKSFWLFSYEVSGFAYVIKPFCLCSSVRPYIMYIAVNAAGVNLHGLDPFFISCRCWNSFVGYIFKQIKFTVSMYEESLTVDCSHWLI